MNPLHPSQRQTSPGGNLFSYGSQQEDFSTPFNDANSFADPNQLFDQNFHQSLPPDFQSNNEEPSEQEFQHSLASRNQYGAFAGAPPESQTWSSSTYLDMNPYSFNQPPTYDNNRYGQQSVNPYGNDMNMNYAFANRSYNPSQQAQRNITISPAVIDRSEQPDPPTGSISSDVIWRPQDQPASSDLNAESVLSKPTTPIPQPLAAIQSEAAAIQVTSAYPPHDQEAVQKGVPSGTQSDGFHIRNVADYRDSAEAKQLKGWIYITSASFETGESRLASLPEAPPRSSVAQLREKLSNSEAARLQPAAKAKIEDKLRRRERIKGKKKGRPSKVTPVVKDVKAVGAVTGLQQSVEESDSETYTDSSGSNSGSDYEGDSDVDIEPSPLPSAKPSDSVGASKYEVLEAVWAPSAKRLSPDALKSRFGPWLENVQRARKDWKTGTTASERTAKKKLLEEMIRLTTKHGHYNFIESIDQLTPLATLVAASVTEMVKAERFDDTLVEAIILLFLKISVIKWSFLLQTRLNKLMPRIVKNTKGTLKGAAELLVEKINQSEKASKDIDKKALETEGDASQRDSSSATTTANIKEKSSVDAKKHGSIQDETRKVSEASEARKRASIALEAKKTTATADGIKKTAITGPTKVMSGGPAKSQTLSRTGSSDGISGKPSSSVISTNGAASKEKERTRYVVTKPPSIFSSISAAKKPAPTASSAKAAIKDAKPAIRQDTPPVTKPDPIPAAPRAPVFSFSETLASIGKPKEEQKTDKETLATPASETEEQRRKRLRKESRRHLRVSWPGEDKLCQIKVFDHDVEDEMAHDPAEVADLKDEGRAFKREYRQQHNSMADFEQDLIKESDDVLDPEPTDFGDIEIAQAKTNVETRAGGHKTVVSVEAADQRKREQGVMIAIYASQQDIPAAPREPPTDNWTGPQPQYDLGDPPQWIRNRSAREIERMPGNTAPKAADPMSDLLKNLSQYSQTQSAPSAQFASSNGVDPSIQAVLSQFANSGGQPTPQQPAAYDPQAAINLFMSMQGGQNSANSAGMATPSSLSLPQSAPTTSASTDLSSILSTLTSIGNPSAASIQPPSSIPTVAQQMSNGGSSNAVPGVDPDILAFLNQYNAAGSQNAQPTQQQNTSQQDLSSILGFLGQQQSQQQPPSNQLGQWSQQQISIGGSERKRGRDSEAGTGNVGSKKKRQHMVDAGGICKYWKSGKCHYGDQCSFLHD